MYRAFGMTWYVRIKILKFLKQPEVGIILIHGLRKSPRTGKNTFCPKYFRWFSSKWGGKVGHFYGFSKLIYSVFRMTTTILTELAT